MFSRSIIAGARQRAVLKVIVSAALIAYIARGVDLAAVHAYAASADAYHALGAVLLLMSISAVHAQRWRVVLDAVGERMRFTESVRLVLIGYFFNQILPSTVGGDAYRVWGASRRGISLHKAASSVVIDRIFALAALLLMIAAGLPWLLNLVPAAVRWTVLIMVPAAGVAGMVTLLACHRFSGVIERYKAGRFMLLAAAAMRDIALDIRASVVMISLTVVGYTMLSGAVYVLARAIAVDVALGHALLLIPLVTLITVVPVSIGGWGLREGAMVLALGLIGVPATAAFSLSILYGVATVASGVPGAVIWWMGRGGPATQA